MGKRSREEQLKNLSLSQNKKGKLANYLILAAVAAVLIAAVAGLVLLSKNNGATTAAELGEVVAPPAGSNDRLHIKKGEEHVAYTSNPPSSGPHYAGVASVEGFGPVQCKTYTDEIEDEGVIHNLEHGVVWVSYLEKNDKGLAEKLKAITEDYTKVVLSPRSKNDARIALVSWGRVLKLDSFEEQKIRDFIKLYRSSEAAPERFASCGTTNSGN